MPSVTFFNMLSVVILSVILVNVVASYRQTTLILTGEHLELNIKDQTDEN
jgi:hypothetical protein